MVDTMPSCRSPNLHSSTFQHVHLCIVTLVNMRTLMLVIMPDPLGRFCTEHKVLRHVHGMLLVGSESVHISFFVDFILFIYFF